MELLCRGQRVENALFHKVFLKLASQLMDTLHSYWTHFTIVNGQACKTEPRFLFSSYGDFLSTNAINYSIIVVIKNVVKIHTGCLSNASQKLCRWDQLAWLLLLAKYR